MRIKNELVGLRKRPFLVAVAIIVAIEIVYLFWFNFSHIYQCTDQDAAKLMTHMIEIVRNKKILIPDWSYVSTCEIDTAMLMAFPIYIVTKNVWVSFALSNCIYMLVLLFVIIWIFKNARIPMEYAFGMCSVIYVPYSLGMVDYLNMLFIKTGQYSIKVLVPLLAIAILTYKKTNIFKIITSILWVFIVYIVGFSSGPMILVLALAPIILAYLINWLVIRNLDDSKDLINLYNTIMLAVGIVVSIVGLAFYKNYNDSVSAVHASLLYADEIPDKFHATVVFFFKLINSLPEEWTDRINLAELAGLVSGGGYVLRFILLIFIIVAVVNYVFQFFKCRNNTESQATVIALLNYCVVVILTNVLILFLQSYNVQRYYLLEFFLMLIIATVFFKKWVEGFSELGRNIFSAMVIAGVCLIWYTSTLYTNYLLTVQDHYGFCFGICDYFEKYDVDNIIVINDPGMAEVCRVILPEEKISNYTREYNNYSGMDWYKSVDKASYYGNSSIIATVETDLSPIFGEDVASKYTYETTIGDYNIFVSYELGVPTVLEN